MTDTITKPGAIATNLAAILGFVRAVAGDLPDPSGITTYGHGPRVYLQFESLDDLRNWAAYSFVDVTQHPHLETIQHRAETTWGPIDGKMVTFGMTFIEDVSAAMPHDCESVDF